MNKEYIQTLLDKYFEGLTSLEEEQKLRDYFASEEVDEEFEIHRSMFQFFIEERFKAEEEEVSTPIIEMKAVRHKRPSRVFVRALISVAACLAILLTVKTYYSSQDNKGVQSYAYIDGERVTDIDVIQKYMLETLDGVSDNQDEILSTQIDIIDDFWN